MVFPKSSRGLESLGAVVEGWDAPSEKLRNPPKSYKKQLPYSEELARFGGGDAGVGGEAVEMVEARARGPRWESGFAQLGEALLEAIEWDAGEGVARGTGQRAQGLLPSKWTSPIWKRTTLRSS